LTPERFPLNGRPPPQSAVADPQSLVGNPQSVVGNCSNSRQLSRNPAVALQKIKIFLLARSLLDASTSELNFSAAGATTTSRRHDHGYLLCLDCLR
jgi:hypothetical protein